MDAFLQKRSRLGGVEPHLDVSRSHEDGILTTCSEKYALGDGFGGCPWVGKITKVSPNDPTLLSTKRLGRRFPVDANVPKCRVSV